MERELVKFYSKQNATSLPKILRFHREKPAWEPKRSAISRSVQHFSYPRSPSARLYRKHQWSEVKGSMTTTVETEDFAQLITAFDSHPASVRPGQPSRRIWCRRWKDQLLNDRNLNNRSLIIPTISHDANSCICMKCDQVAVVMGNARWGTAVRFADLWQRKLQIYSSYAEWPGICRSKSIM